MNLYTPTRTVLLLIAAVSLSGCALKPKAASRFEHPVNADGSCSCYTCQHAAAAPSPTMASPHPAAPLASCESCQAGEVHVGEVQVGERYSGELSANPVSEEFYPSPIDEEGQVESFNTSEPDLIKEELPVVEEIEPSVSDNGFETAEPLLAVGGGGFETQDSDDSDNDTDSDSNDDILIAPSDPEPTLAQKPAEESNVFGSLNAEGEMDDSSTRRAIEVEEEAPAQAPEDLVAAPVEAVESAVEEAIEDLAPVAPVEVPEPISVPKPASTFKAGQPFKPGQPFRPGKRAVSPNDSTWNDLDTKFYQHGADEKSDNIENSESNAKVAAKPVPKLRRLSGKRVVLRANKVDQNVVHSPSAKSGSAVTVTPLPASFRTAGDSDNWLRQRAHSTIASVAPSQVYEATDKSTDGPFVTTARAPAVEPAIETQVRLKAIQLNHRVAVVENQNVQQSVSQPAAIIKKPVSPTTVAEDTTESVRVASPPKRKPKRPYTARANEKDGVVIPPWRIK